MAPEEITIYRNVGIVVAVVAALWSLAVVLCREWVKADLIGKGLTPRSVRWRLFMSTKAACRFNVRYVTSDGLIHKAQCRTSWYRPRLAWESDQIIGREDDASGRRGR